MLKKFFSNLLSSFMGAWIALVLFCIIAVIVVFAIIAKSGISSQETVSVSKGSILKLDLSGEVIEINQSAELDYLNVVQGKMERPQALASIVKALEEGEENGNIKALYIECNGVSAAPATLNAIREAVVKFNKHKPVYAYGDNYTMADYYIASAADSLYINPGGQIELCGISGAVPYMKGLFDKIGISFQVVKVGTFKSAVEPYVLTEMSAPARAQLDTLYGNLWNHILKGISEKRKALSPAQLQNLANEKLLAFAPQSVARKAGLFNRAIYKRQVKGILANVAGVEEKKLNIVSTTELAAQSNFAGDAGAKNQIAVLYAVGEIVDHGSQGISAEKLVPQIVKLAENDKVKGMVLRVNSPGGSAFASEQIGEALDYFMSKGKTLTVSMGDYAASGGYWISACADRIFADPLTVTGSIGIFGLIPNAAGLTQKLGVNIETVSTTPNANFPNLYQPMSEMQIASLQQYVERGYDTFISRVAKGRKMSKARVDAIGQGRVWDAMSAKRIGLVDQLGSLQQSIEWTATKAGISAKYNVAIYPQLEPTIWDFIPSEGMEAAIERIKEKLGPTYDDAIIRRALATLRRPVMLALMPEMELTL